MTETNSHLGRNMTLGVLNGVLFYWALAFLSGSTIFPLFISGLTDSRVIIGAMSTLEDFGWYLPQFFAGAIIAGNPRVLGYYNKISILRIALFATGVIMIFIIADSNNSLLLLIFGLSFLTYALVSGMAGIAFMEIVGKMIPTAKRGTFFGLRMLFGGLLAALSGPLVKRMLDHWQFPVNFGYLYIFSFAGIFLGLAVFAFIKEKPGNSTKTSYSSNLRSGLTLFKSNHNLRRLIGARYLSHTYLLASPFYIIMAVENLGVSRPMAGTYLSFEMTGYLSANLVWAWISNKLSNKLVLKLASLCALLAPVLAIISSYRNPGYFIYGLTFFVNGAAVSGINLGYNSYLLEILDDTNRPMGVGLVHTLIAPTVCMSAVGGLIGQLVTLRILFYITLVFLALSFLNIIRLIEPHRKAV